MKTLSVLQQFRMLFIALSSPVLWAPMKPRTAMRFRQVDAAEEQRELLARELDRRTRRYRPGQRPCLEAFGANPPTGVVPEQDLDSVLP